jgi:tetratricopeptide (TPR) repeat protein
MSTNDKFQLALAYNNSGNFLQAELVCREILLTHPNHIHALHLLGVISYQYGDNDNAIDYIQKAIQLNPSYADAYNSLGLALKEVGELDEAKMCYQNAKQLNPASYDGAMNTLDELAIQYGTDKSSKCHHYTHRYFKYFNPLRKRRLRIIEIGIAQGNSLRMWKDFFPNAEIFAIDKNPNCNILNIERVKIYIGDQSDEYFLESFVNEIGSGFDIIIDDGGHMMSQQIITFHILFSHLKPKGIYVIEDLHTSYNSEYNGGLHQQNSTIEFLKNLIDDLNFKGRAGIGNHEKTIKGLKGNNVSYFERHIDSIHFYQSICFLFKRDYPR